LRERSRRLSRASFAPWRADVRLLIAGAISPQVIPLICAALKV